MTCFTTHHIQRGGATFFNSEGAKINDSLGPPGVGPPGYAPADGTYPLVKDDRKATLITPCMKMPHIFYFFPFLKPLVGQW